MKKKCLVLSIIIVLVAILFLGTMLLSAKLGKVKKPIATIQIEGYEQPIKIELDPVAAPNAVANFIKLANSGFYTDFEMTIGTNQISSNASKDNMAKISRLNGQTDNDFVYGIKGDFLQNGNKDNLIRHEKGVVTMLRQDYSYVGYTEEGYNSANCNFAILTEDKADFNGYYAAFGKVVEGMDVVEKISSSRVEDKKEEADESEEANGEDVAEAETETQTESAEKVENDTESKSEEEEKVNVIKIKSVTVDTFGVDYGNPETVNFEETYDKVQEIYAQYFGSSSSVVSE